MLARHRQQRKTSYDNWVWSKSNTSALFLCEGKQIHVQDGEIQNQITIHDGNRFSLLTSL
jgi:hypothetical protein